MTLSRALPFRLSACATIIALAASAPLLAQNRLDDRPGQGRGTPVGDMLGTMNHGFYQCVLPGDAAAQAFIEVPEQSFTIGQGSSYRNVEGTGVYLMHGKNLIFTRGPKKNQRFQRLGPNTLQAVEEDGTLGRMICTRLGGVD